MENINILLLGGAKRVSLALRFIQAGLKLNKKVNIFSYELNNEVPIYKTAEVILGKLWNAPDILLHLEKVVKSKNINIILPCVDPAIIIASKLRQILSECFIPVSESFICTTMFDKVECNNYLKKLNIKLPSTDLNYPMIAKPRKGSASAGIKKLESEEDFKLFNLKYDAIDYIIQQFINAEEYTVDAYINNDGKFVGAVPRLRMEVFAGEVIKSVTVRDSEIINISEFVSSSGGFRGPITIQYLKEKTTGINYLMEINPRLGGGVINSIEAGFNIPLYIIQEYLGLHIPTVNNWRENLLMTRSFEEVFFADYYRS